MKTRLQVGHDRLSLTVTSALKVKVKLSITRSGESVSAPNNFPIPTIEALVQGFCHALKSKAPYGDIMARLEKLAQDAETFKQFADAMSASVV